MARRTAAWDRGRGTGADAAVGEARRRRVAESAETTRSTTGAPPAAPLPAPPGSRAALPGVPRRGRRTGPVPAEAAAGDGRGRRRGLGDLRRRGRDGRPAGCTPPGALTTAVQDTVFEYLRAFGFQHLRGPSSPRRPRPTARGPDGGHQRTITWNSTRRPYLTFHRRLTGEVGRSARRSAASHSRGGRPRAQAGSRVTSASPRASARRAELCRRAVGSAEPRCSTVQVGLSSAPPARKKKTKKTKKKKKKKKKRYPTAAARTPCRATKRLFKLSGDTTYFDIHGAALSVQVGKRLGRPRAGPRPAGGRAPCRRSGRHERPGRVPAELPPTGRGRACAVRCPPPRSA